MTGPQLEALVLSEVRRARLRMNYEVRRGPTGLHVLLHSDWAWLDGIGNRRMFAHGDERRREAVIAVLPLHSRVPRVSYGGGDGKSIDLWPPPRCPEPVLRALVSWAIAKTYPTPRRLREARRRLRAAGVRLSDFSRKPRFTRRGAA